MSLESIALLVPLLPLGAALACGLGGRWLGRTGAHAVAILSVGSSCGLALLIARLVLLEGWRVDYDWYVWADVGSLRFSVGFLIDGLSAVMMVVVSFVSLMVHIYTMAYMREDPGYQRFYAYIALFTFAMLMLVMSNNFMQLFFGWEAVGLVSYLLIGFWYERPSAVRANLKAFLVNRVGDFGFLIGIGLLLAQVGSLAYGEVFAARGVLVGATIELWPGLEWQAATVICLALFAGAMGKSAQIPLHVWLPDSMEGPTPISALIHAATMVTAGIFMVARMSPLFELSETALATVLAIGGATAFFMALLGLVQHDIKRVVAYSTLSQLGYMTAALGASAYSAALFHLVTHAFFKALLFLAAGSVIVALHHEQDMRNMGGLGRKLRITFSTAVIGSLALAGIPPLAGFFSKDAIIAAVEMSSLPGSTAVWLALVAGAFITAFYSFRLIALVFLGNPRMNLDSYDRVREPAWPITGPLLVLAVLSVIAGWLLLEPMVVKGTWLAGAVIVDPAHDSLAALRATIPDAATMVAHATFGAATIAAVAGIILALAVYVLAPSLPSRLAAACGPAYRLLLAKYGFDEFNDKVLAGGTRAVGRLLASFVDGTIIDGAVNGGAKAVVAGARACRRLQTGRIYHYAFVMIVCLAGFAAWFLRI